MGILFYQSCRAAARFITRQTMRETVLDACRADRPGGFLLACTHLSHLEPFLISGVVTRQVRWMARVEFYQRRWQAAALDRGGAFPVDRFGNSLRAVRTAIRLAKSGECVGIFPEGGVTQGRQSVLRGGLIKQGVCTIAIEACVPVVPVIVLGTERLNRIEPWLPFRRGRLWYAFGKDILPPAPSRSRREDRQEMSARVQAEFVRAYHALLGHSGLSDDQIP